MYLIIFINVTLSIDCELLKTLQPFDFHLPALVLQLFQDIAPVSIRNIYNSFPSLHSAISYPSIFPRLLTVRSTRRFRIGPTKTSIAPFSGWSRVTMCFLARTSRILRAVWTEALSWCGSQEFFSQRPLRLSRIDRRSCCRISLYICWLTVVPWGRNSMWTILRTSKKTTKASWLETSIFLLFRSWRFGTF